MVMQMDIYIPDRTILVETASELASDQFNPGIDDMTAKECLNYLLLNSESIVSQLTNGTYKPKAALSFSIIQKNGKERNVCRLSALDTIIQRSTAHILSEYCEEIFSDFSFAYRQKKGRNAAVAQFAAFSKSFNTVIKIDIKDCYDSIDHRILLHALSDITANKNFLRLLDILIKTDIADENGIQSRKKGLLQGAPLSPVLCNIYLHSLDMFMQKRNMHFCRYADDIVLFLNTAEESAKYINDIAEFLSSKLQLSINTEKLKIECPEESVYLGFSFQKDESGNVFAHAATENEITFNNRWVHDFGKGSNKRINILSDGILSKKDLTLLFEGKSQTMIPVTAVEQINIYSSVILAPQSIKTAFENGISINIFDRYGHLLGRFEPEKEFKDISLPLLQLQAYNHTKTLRKTYAKNMLLSSLHNIRLNIRYYKKQLKSEKCSIVLEKIDCIEKEIKKCSDIEKMLLLEARMRELYYSCFNEFIKDSRYIFTKRTKRPPMDELNSLISFGNTFLYNYIAMEINKTPLDIRIGFLHATNKRRESLNLDIADIFKPLIIDRTIFTLINKHIISFESHFQSDESGAVYLNKDGKRVFLEALYDKLNRELTVSDEKMTYHQIITQDIRNLCGSLRGRKTYKGFRQVR